MSDFAVQVLICGSYEIYDYFYMITLTQTSIRYLSKKDPELATFESNDLTDFNFYLGNGYQRMSLCCNRAWNDKSTGRLKFICDTPE